MQFSLHCCQSVCRCTEKNLRFQQIERGNEGCHQESQQDHQRQLLPSAGGTQIEYAPSTYRNWGTYLAQSALKEF